MDVVDLQRAAEIQVVLEGVRLPATRAELVRYAARWDPNAADELRSIPNRSYALIDEVGEALAATQPRLLSRTARPHAESGLPPGGRDYVEPRPQSGAVRSAAPPANPPQQTLERQSQAQRRQQAVQSR